MTKRLAVLAASAATLLLAGGSPADQSDQVQRLIRGLTVNRGFVVFSYAGDLWRVGRRGGTAERLTEGPAEDDYPVISPDGLNIAFSRRGADDWDVYVTGTQGGEPRRLTYNPEADVARGWTPDGSRVLFVSHRDEEFRFRLYTIPANGGFPSALELPRGWDGSYEPGGERIAYVPAALPTDLMGVEWRHYRGGMASRIWLAELASGKVALLPRDSANDRDPMWVGGSIFFVSDRSGTYNLHRYDPAADSIEQLTRYERYGVETAAAGGGSIAFVQDGQIRIFDPASGAVETLAVELEPDRSELEPGTARGSRWIDWAAPFPKGDKVVLGYRGEVVTFDGETGRAENLTRSSGVAERYPVVSPDGRWIAYFSDQSGQYQLYLRRADEEGAGAVRKIAVELRPSFYRDLRWSPDSKRLAFSDSRLTLWVVDIETGGARRVSTSSDSNQGSYQPNWSPDGVWLAYSRYEANRVRAIYLYNAVRGRALRLTGARVHAEHPVFDKSGRYLYFVASNTAALGDFGWSVLSGELFRPLVGRRLQLVVLREGLPSPVLPVTGTPNPEADRPTAPGPGPAGVEGTPQRRPRPGGRNAGREARGQERDAALIEFRGIGDRIVPLPLPAHDFVGLAPGDSGQLYALVAEWPDAPAPGVAPTHTLYHYQLSEPRELEPLIEEVDDWAVTADGSRILYRTGQTWAFFSGSVPPDSDPLRLDLEALEVEVDRAAEWQQMYREAWRLMRDFFYDPNYHGQDLAELESHYASYLPHITRRRDLNWLIGKALGQLSVSHLEVSGGDQPEVEEPPGRVGLLGADYEIDRGRYRLRRIYRSGHFNAGHPLLSAPLDQPGVQVAEGEYLLAVDGESMTAERNLFAYFEGKALQPVEITVAQQPDGKASRTYTVVPLPGENTLRTFDWAERNREIVDEKSQAVLGYVYIPNFGPHGLELAFRQLLENADRRGLIIDQRFAGGGITADYLIELLSRTPLYYYSFRFGDVLGVPTNAPPAAKVLLVNDVNASAAETFALMFQLRRLGKVVGTRTMGAGIGPYGLTPRLIDGGRVVIPNRAAFDPAGGWTIENRGIEPDVEVELLPAEWRAGRDPQLESAISAALQAIVDQPPAEVKRPNFPLHP